jgi:hypothetical protein
MPHSEAFVPIIQPDATMEVMFQGYVRGVTTVVVELPAEDTPHLWIEMITAGGRHFQLDRPIRSGEAIELGGVVTGPIGVILYNKSAETQVVRAVLWSRLANGHLVADTVGWQADEKLRAFTAWRGIGTYPTDAQIQETVRFDEN